MSKLSLAAKVELILKMEGAEYVKEYAFCAPFRKWRFDIAFPGIMVAIEIDGSQFTMGRHQRPIGFGKDIEKLNAAALLGWTVYRFTTIHFKGDCQYVREVIKAIFSNQEINRDNPVFIQTKYKKQRILEMI